MVLCWWSIGLFSSDIGLFERIPWGTFAAEHPPRESMVGANCEMVWKHISTPTCRNISSHVFEQRVRASHAASAVASTRCVCIGMYIRIHTYLYMYIYVHICIYIYVYRVNPCGFRVNLGLPLNPVHTSIHRPTTQLSCPRVGCVRVHSTFSIQTSIQRPTMQLKVYPTFFIHTCIHRQMMQLRVHPTFSIHTSIHMPTM